MADLTEFEKVLAARCLKMASEEFGRHGCNDFPLLDTPAAREMLDAMDRWNAGGEPDEEDYDHPTDGEGRVLTQDWYVMDYLAHRLLESAGGK